MWVCIFVGDESAEMLCDLVKRSGARKQRKNCATGFMCVWARRDMKSACPIAAHDRFLMDPESVEATCFMSATESSITWQISL